MNVLVTGCKGQLGNELYKIITEKKSELGEIPQCFHDCKDVYKRQNTPMVPRAGSFFQKRHK